jgi:hypothetical protein
VVQPTQRSEPVIGVTPAPPAPGANPSEWRVAWQIENRGDRPLALLAAWLPHGKLRAAERALEPPPRVLPGESARLDLTAAFDEAPGTVVENTFVILRALYGDEPWRIMVRLLITTDAQGGPANTIELITAHPIGFSR